MAARFVCMLALLCSVSLVKYASCRPTNETSESSGGDEAASTAAAAAAESAASTAAPEAAAAELPTAASGDRDAKSIPEINANLTDKNVFGGAISKVAARVFQQTAPKIFFFSFQFLRSISSSFSMQIHSFQLSSATLPSNAWQFHGRTTRYHFHLERLFSG